MKIVTDYAPPPIPMRQFDWRAIDDDTHDLGRPIGWGATEQEAIDDLMAQLEELDAELETPTPSRSERGQSS